MAYAPIDDGFPTHPKVLALLDDEESGLAALGLWAFLLPMVRAQADPAHPDQAGVVTRRMLRLAGADEHMAKLLVDARAGHEHGLWEPHPQGWRYHNFLERAQLSHYWAKSDQARAAAQTRWHPPDQGKHADAYADADTDADTDAYAKTTTTKNRNLKSKDLVTYGDRDPAAPDPFDAFWHAYPRKVGKSAARRKWVTLVRQGVRPEVMTAAAQAYRDKPGREPQYTAHPTTWLNQGRWEDEDEATRPGPAAPGRRDQQVMAALERAQTLRGSRQ